MDKMIKKFKNGKIKLNRPAKNDSYYWDNGVLIDEYYHDDMFFSDLYINQINGYMYITDFNTGLVYELGSYLLQNPIKYILDEITEGGRMYLYPLSKKCSLSLLEDLENGY